MKPARQGHVGRVGLENRRDRSVVGEAVGESVEEAVDRLVGDLGELQKRVVRSCDGASAGIEVGGAQVHEPAVDCEHFVAGSVRIGERRVDLDKAVAR